MRPARAVTVALLLAAGLSRAAAPSASAVWTQERRDLLRSAAADGKLEAVRELLAASGDADSAAIEPALSAAMSMDRYEVARLLLDRGARCTDAGGAPLEAASSHGVKCLPLCLRQDSRLKARVPAGEGERFPHEKLLKEWAGRFDRASRDAPWHPLLVAASFGDPELVRPVLRHIAVDAATPSGWTPLMEAASEGQDAVVRLLLARGAAIDRKGPSGTTALQVAAKYGQTGAVLLLVEQGAAGAGQALLTAVEQKQLATAKALLEGAKAEAKLEDDDRAAALDRAVRDGFAAGVELLLANRAPVGRALPYACSDGKREVAQQLRRGGTSWTDDLACLIAAARKGNVDVLRDVVRPERAAEARVRDGLAAALIAALESDRVEAAKLLLELGASAKGAGPSESIPLLYARSAPAVRLLLDRGADVNAATRYSSALERFSRDRSDEPLLLALLDAGLKYEPQPLLCRAAKAGMGAVVTRMLAKGASGAASVCEEGRSAFEAAFDADAWAATRAMLEGGALLEPGLRDRAIRDQVEYCNKGESRCDGAWLKALYSRLGPGEAKQRWVSGDGKGATFLSAVARTSQVDAALELIARGADVNARSDDASTALHAAVEAKQVAMVQALARAGADLSAVNANFDSAVHLAVCDATLLKVLVDLKADLNLDAGAGTPLDRATRQGCSDGAALLERLGAKRTRPAGGTR
jgi:ankyrin repeat protein